TSIAQNNFVGRDRELVELLDGLTEARAGRGQLVLVAGDAGMGKTRIADELAARAHPGGAGVLWGRCWAGEGAPPFWPWERGLRACGGTSGISELAEEMGSGAAEIARLAPQICPRPSDRVASPELTPAQAQFRLFDSIATFLRNAARRTPLVLILDDLHW